MIFRKATISFLAPTVGIILIFLTIGLLIGGLKGLKISAIILIIIRVIISIIEIILSALYEKQQKKLKKELDDYISTFESYIKNGIETNEIALLDRLTNRVITYEEFINLKKAADSIDYKYKLKKVKVNYPYESICRLNFNKKT